jgi:hypothetical protein
LAGAREAWEEVGEVEEEVEKMSIEEIEADEDPIKPRGFVETYFPKSGYPGPKAKFYHDVGRISIFADDDMEWFFPIKNHATSQKLVLYYGLVEFLNRATLPRSAIDLYVDDIDIDDNCSGKAPSFLDEKLAWNTLKNTLKRRPHIAVRYLPPELLKEKLKFLKMRFAKGQKGMMLVPHGQQKRDSDE